MYGKRLAWAAVAAAAVWASVGEAQERRPFRPRDPAEFLDQLVRTAAEMYKLDDGQKDALRVLLDERSKVTQEKWEAVGRHFRAYREKQENGEEVDWDAARAEAAPLFEAARKVMEETRGLIREQILDDEQRRIYDKAKADGRDPLTGREDFMVSPAERLARRFTGKGFEEQSWEQWLEAVDRAAKLTGEQSAKAKEMLAMAKEAAARYRRDKEDDYRKMAADLAELAKDAKAPADKRRAVEKAAAELAAPIDGIGKKWREDVTALLDEKQKQAIEGLDRRFGGGRGRGGQPRDRQQ